MSKKTIALASVLLLVCSVALAQYTLPWNSFNSGGSPGSGSGYTLNGSVGIPVQGLGSGGGYTGFWGFWYGVSGITPLAAGWQRQTDLPLGIKGKRIKDGGALAYAENSTDGTGYIYALKGNNRYEFYRYNTEDGSWSTMESIPAINPDTKKKTVKKGSVLVTGGDDNVYASKGNNTRYFWEYDLSTGKWAAIAAIVPYAGDKVRGLKEGSDAVAVDDYIYLLKGSGTTEFYRWQIGNPAWETMTDAPLGPSSKPFKNGSQLAYDGANTIYALKGSYNTLYTYDVLTRVWTTKDSVPKIGSTGRKKKVKDGAGMVYNDGLLYVIKGGNTNEFFVYDCAAGRWSTLADMPLVTKRVKGGGALTYSPKQKAFYAFRGNNTLEFWSYGLGAKAWSGGTVKPSVETGALNKASVYALEVGPNPFTRTASVTYSLPHATRLNIRVYDITGQLKQTLSQGETKAGSYTTRIDASTLARGVYILKFTTDDYQTNRKLIIE